MNVASMLASRIRFGAEVVNGKIYTAGGWSDTETNITEQYDPIANRWQYLSPMQYKR